MAGNRPAKSNMTFESLVTYIRRMHADLASRAGRAVNVCLTVRNWLIGGVIVEYEQGGSDRAKYGDQLLDRLAERLIEEGVDRVDERELRRYRQFYQAYPQIRESLSPESARLFLRPLTRQSLLDSLSGKTALTRIRETPSPNLAISGERLLNSLSFSHFDLLIQLDDSVKRAFYEIECIRGNWSVRELKRQIGSLYYERSGLSRNKRKLSGLVRAAAEMDDPKLAVRDPYVFEFLGIKSREVMGECGLEDALLDKLQEFLLEMGRGFCFEARQKRITIGGEYFFVDLVLYHRILKCHVLIELKVDDFKHEHLGQLNTYVNWFRANEMTRGDNHPIGILLCTRKNHALVEYAKAGMNNRLFVSKYRLGLPGKDEIRRFIEGQIVELSGSFSGGATTSGKMTVEKGARRRHD